MLDYTSTVAVEGVVSAITAGLACVWVTLMIERFGGSIGGVIGTIPTTMVPFTAVVCIGSTQQQLVDILYIVPVGMCIDVAYLWLWRELPKTKVLDRYTTLHGKLIMMLLICLVLWLIVAAAVILIVQQLTKVLTIRAIGVFFFVITAIYGVINIVYKHVPSPGGTKKVSIPMYVARGSFAAAAIGASVGIATVSNFTAGMASVFPAVFSTAQISLWLSQGYKVNAGAVGPMSVGCLSISVYAIMYAELYHTILSSVNQSEPAAITITILVCMTAAVVCVSIPVYLFIRWANRRHALRHQAQMVLQEQAVDSTSLQNDDITLSAQSDFQSSKQDVLVVKGDDDKQLYVQVDDTHGVVLNEAQILEAEHEADAEDTDTALAMSQLT